MTAAVARSLEARRHLVVEAGTGCGKTMAYLVPLLLEGQTAVISTGTIALQTQLVEKDLVFLQRAFPRPFTFALAKGRNNYLCLPKLWEAERSAIPGSDALRAVESVRAAWEGGRWDGDVGRLPFSVNPRFWSEDLGTRHDDCLGSKCPAFEQCPIRAARRTWGAADVVVANHALYFMDMATGGAVLPEHDFVIFDEAHHLEEVAIRTLGVEIGKWAVGSFLSKAERRVRGLPPALRVELDRSDAQFQRWAARHAGRNRRLLEEPDLEEVAEAFVGWLDELAGWIGKLDVEEFNLLAAAQDEARTEAEGQREALLMQCMGLRGRWAHFAALPDAEEDYVQWIDWTAGGDLFTLHSACLNVSQLLAEKLWSQRTAILTSATLTVGGKFGYLEERLGLPEHDSEVLSSPFDFQQQALLYLARDLPNPNDPGYNQAIAPRIEEILERTQGRAFVLFTSYRSLREVSETLTPRLSFPCKTQEDMPRGPLLSWFRRTPHAVLFATSSFWEGVDVPGAALSCVIIDRLPFSHPEDPVNQATVERLKAGGKDWFNDYTLPKAVLSLKQGFGRLIRSRSDRGVVAILDPRVCWQSQGYGRTIVRSLPPARRIFRLDGGDIEALLQPEERVPAPTA